MPRAHRRGAPWAMLRESLVAGNGPAWIAVRLGPPVQMRTRMASGAFDLRFSFPIFPGVVGPPGRDRTCRLTGMNPCRLPLRWGTGQGPRLYSRPDSVFHNVAFLAMQRQIKSLAFFFRTHSQADE